MIIYIYILYRRKAFLRNKQQKQFNKTSLEGRLLVWFWQQKAQTKNVSNCYV